jgi:hypothetical protein
MKKIYFIAIALIISCIAASGQSTETKTPPSATIQTIPAANVGNITVDINLTGFSPDIASFQWTILFDSTILQYQSTSNWFTGVTGVTITPTYGANTGRITMVWGDSPVVINSLLCKLNFNYLGTPTCTNVSWGDKPTPREIGNGSFVAYSSVNYVNGQVCQNTVGVAENSQQNNISIFPNPSSGNLNISLPANQYKSELEIFNNIGMKVYNQSVAQGTNSLNLNLDLPNGAYIIKLSNQESTNSKLVIIAK